MDSLTNLVTICHQAPEGFTWTVNNELFETLTPNDCANVYAMLEMLRVRFLAKALGLHGIEPKTT